jgi:integrase
MRLTAKAVQHAPLGWHCDGRGLYLQCTAGTDGRVNRSWVFRYRANERERYMGLGPLADVSLAEARNKAATARKLRLDGIDPLEAKRDQQNELRLAAAKQRTFGQCLETFLEFKSPEWSNPKHAEQWAMTLRKYAKPLHPFSPDKIDLALVVETLRPIWHKVPETASRTRQRIEAVLDHWAALNHVHGYVNPAAWERVKHALPSVAALKKKNGEGHHAALPHAEIPQFMAELRERDSLSARALEFCVLTAARTGETIGATWDEIDFNAKTWTVPASRMKAGKEHKVPLCNRAIEILQGLDHRTKNLFPLSNMGMAELLKGMRPGVTVHGMRACFRTWSAERTNHPHIVCELALGHTQNDKLMQAYQRGALFSKRQKLMTEWEKFCGKPTAVSPAVVPFRKSS